MVLSRDHLIEGVIVEKGTNIKIIEQEYDFKVLRKLPSQKEYYDGASPEQGGTSMKISTPAPAIVSMHKNGWFDGAENVIDFGSGRTSRNANFLRQQGFNVFAYDPFHGDNSSGWGVDEVSNRIPSGITFDVGFTSFVTNVVPKHIEDVIVDELESVSKKTYHITRRKDIFVMAKDNLLKGNKFIMDFYLNEYGGKLPLPEGDKQLLDDIVMDFCLYGFITKRGFQRIPEMEYSGYDLKINTSAYKVYGK